MARKKKTSTGSAMLVNRSRQRCDVLLQGPDGTLRTVIVLRGSSVPIKTDEISEQLKSMLSRPDLYGLKLVEDAAPAPVEEPEESSGDEEDDG